LFGNFLLKTSHAEKFRQEVPLPYFAHQRELNKFLLKNSPSREIERKFFHQEALLLQAPAKKLCCDALLHGSFLTWTSLESKEFPPWQFSHYYRFFNIEHTHKSCVKKCIQHRNRLYQTFPIKVK